jgi:hypothetical protein
MAKGILIAAFDYSTAAEDEFNDWYDLEHIPERQRVPGFLSCQRWLGDGKLAIATYDLDTVGVMQSAPYRAIGYENSSVWTKRVTGLCKRLLRFEGEQILPGDQVGPSDAGALLLNAMNVDPAHEAEFNAWYDQEHVKLLAAVPGCLSARRFRAADQGPDKGSHKYVAVYHLASSEVQEKPEWKAAVQTPWTERIRPHYRDRVRLLGRRYVRQARAGVRAA